MFLQVTDMNAGVGDMEIIRKYDLADRLPVQEDHDYTDAPSFLFVDNLSEFKKEAISYIAGYVVRMAQKKVVCPTCSQALGSTMNLALSSFLRLKDNGGLIKPSLSVIRVCEETEVRVQRMVKKLA